MGSGRKSFAKQTPQEKDERVGEGFRPIRWCFRFAVKKSRSLEGNDDDFAAPALT